MDKTANFYIEKYKLIKHYDLDTRDTTYQRRYKTINSDVQYILTVNIDDSRICTLVRFSFDRTTGAYRQKFIENIPNDLKEMIK